MARRMVAAPCIASRQPPPEAEDIGAAFVANVLDRAAAADIDLSSEDIEEVRNWFGLP